MPEEEKDQTAATEAPKSEEGYKLPERGFFQGEDMMKFAEQMEEVSKAAPTPAKKETRPCPEGVPCPDEEKEAKPAEKGKPFKILKVKGKEVPVYSEEEYNELAQKGAHYTRERQKDSEWERDLQSREERIERLSPHIERIVEFLDGGGELPGARAPRREEPQLEEEILDPVAADRMKRLEERLGSLESENKNLKGRAQVDSFERAQRELTETFNSVSKEVPFEQVLDEDNRNISQEVFAGLIALKANKDALRMKSERGFKMKTMAEYMTDTAKDLAYLEKHFRGNGPGEVSAEIVKTKFPKVAEALGQEAIDAYLQKIEESGEPVVRSTKTEPSVRPPKREIKSIADGLEQGLNDPEIMEGLGELGRKFRISNT
jgi:hypothetical protein